MLLFLGCVSAVYFYHIKSELFLGTEKDMKIGTNPYFKPVARLDDAIDFNVTEHNSKKGEKVRITLPGDKMSLDVRTGGNSRDLEMITYPSHDGSAQTLEMRLVANGGFVLGYNDFCLLYTDNKLFMTGYCYDSRMADSRFDLYYERVEPLSLKTTETHKLMDSSFAPTNLVSNGIIIGDEYASKYPNKYKNYDSNDKNVVYINLDDRNVTFNRKDKNDLINKGLMIGHSEIKTKTKSNDDYSALFHHGYIDSTNMQSPYNTKKYDRKREPKRRPSRPHSTETSDNDDSSSSSEYSSAEECDKSSHHYHHCDFNHSKGERYGSRRIRSKETDKRISV